MPGHAFIPDRFRPALPLEQLLARGERPPGVEEVPMDALFVGAGPAGLAGAIALARAAKADGPLAGLNIAVLEKASALGEHTLSGAVIDPGPLRALFPDLPENEFPFRGSVGAERFYFLTARRAIRLPLPPPMRNHGRRVVSICELVRWLGARAEELGVNILVGYPAAALLMDGDRVRGVRTAPSGLDRAGAPGAAYQPPTDVTARVTVLAEGTRGALTEAYLTSQNVRSTNPQIFALGIKELWRVARPWDAVVHTMGWPLPRGVFGGSFFYPLADDLVALGLVVGLDSGDAALDPHDLLQQLKTHPMIRPRLEGGEMLEWGAKTIPEGGFHALPERLHGEGVLIAGDAAGLVNVAALKGIHYAVQSGVFAAQAAADALRRNDTSGAGLAAYDALIRGSFIHRDLWRTRQMRLGFQRGLIPGAAIAGLATLSGGRLPSRPLRSAADAAHPRRPRAARAAAPDGRLTFSKLDANFKSGNRTRDDIPLHLFPGRDIPAPAADFYAALCPAGVYEQRDGALVVHAANCIDCKATDVLGPRWTPREGGSGPRYQMM